MSVPDIERMDRRVKVLLLAVSLGTLVVLFASAIWENYFPEWRTYRVRYAETLEEKATDDRGKTIAAQFEIGIDQLVIPELGATERCITCHTGLEDPRMADEPQPYRTHLGSILVDHPPERFGCTICHQGQGRATETLAAHGKVENWPSPMFEKRFMYSSCAQCHDSEALFGSDAALVADDGNTDRSGARLMARGKQLFDSTGCLGCHQLNGRGGSLGPDISLVGNKTRHDFDFSHFAVGEPREVPQWLERHFLEPAEISPGTVMPDMGLNHEDAGALTAYVLSLRRREIPAAYIAPRSRKAISAQPPRGEQLYLKMCSACHGANGEESEVPGIRTPALNNPDSLAVASDDYLRFIIENGRSGTAMEAWGGSSPSLSRDEIDLLVGHIRQWEAPGPDLERVSSRRGDPLMGKAYYQGSCANCHGRQGEGGLGNALNSSSFLEIASDSFLAESIVHGRPGTAMASWRHLPGQAISDLLAYIRSWEPEPPSFEEVQRTLLENPREEMIWAGEVLYRGNCATCHGRAGEGGIGPWLNGPSILPAVDDRFLYQTITRGRPTTAMPAWRHFSAEQLGSLIAWLRSWGNGEMLTLPSPPANGDYELGEVQFKIACAQCHGSEGQGGVGPQLANPSFLRAVSDETLYHWISHGRVGSAMVGFLAEEQGPVELTPARIADVIAYVRHLGSRGKRPIKRTGEGDPALGGQLYGANCASCHGTYGEGASGPQLRNEAFLRSASDGFLAATIVLGRTGTPMQSMIHGQEGLGQIAPERVRDVIAYMRMWDVEAPWSRPRPVAEMSRRAIDSGRRQFAQYCAGCHGPNGLGQADGPDYLAPALNNREFLEAASDGFLLATIARGRSNTAMRPFGVGTGGIVPLGDSDISDIVSFIRTWHEEYPSKGDRSL